MTGNSDDSADSKAGPVRAQVREAALKVSADGSSATLGRRDTAPFSMLGVTWTDPAAKVSGSVEVRTRSAADGNWTSWTPLETDNDGRTETGRSGVRGSTEPRWVGPSYGVEVRVTAGAKVSAKLPAGLQLDTVDPGKGSSLHAAPAAPPGAHQGPPAPAARPDPRAAPPAPPATPPHPP
ncbi:N-acetylmuramoyl-L-alanine amidase, partial [Streptomyces sp. NPDC059744]